MSASVPGIFGHSVFSGAATGPADKKRTATGFAQIFTTMLAKQMHQSMVGADTGPMGIGGGASGDIYGSMLDQALGKTLAKSKSMAGLTAMIGREMSGPRHPIASAFKDSLTKVSASGPTGTEPGRLTNDNGTSMEHVSRFGTAGVSRSDARGPVLLPPAPTTMAPQLQPPSPLEA